MLYTWCSSVLIEQLSKTSKDNRIYDTIQSTTESNINIDKLIARSLPYSFGHTLWLCESVCVVVRYTLCVLNDSPEACNDFMVLSVSCVVWSMCILSLLHYNLPWRELPWWSVACMGSRLVYTKSSLPIVPDVLALRSLHVYYISYLLLYLLPLDKTSYGHSHELVKSTENWLL